MRTNFSSSKLVRLLGDLGNPDRAPMAAGRTVDASSQDFAEKLSLWVSVFDSVTLRAAHQSISAVADEKPSRLPPRGALPVDEQLHQVRTILARAINTLHFDETSDTAPGANRHSLNQPMPMPVPEDAVDFTPYRQRYMEQQRNMDLMIRPLRDNVRQTLSGASPELRQLAALDAVWEQMLAGREQTLLATVPSRLKRRFDSLHKLHQPAVTSADLQSKQHDGSQQPAPKAALWRQPGGWLDLFGRELQEILLAELEVRLEPVTGLIEAFNNADKADGAASPVNANSTDRAGNQIRKYQ